MQQAKKIKVLQTIRQGKIGGGETHVLDLVATLDRSLYDPVVLSFTDGPMITALQQLDIPAHVIPSEKAFDISVWKKVRQLICDEKIDLVHMHGTRASTNILWPARKLRLPVIYTVHGWSFHEGLHPLMKRARIAAEKFITGRTRANICVSESNRQTGIKAFGALNAVVIRNGVDLRKFDRTRTFGDIRESLGIPEDRVVIGYIARMTLQKAPLHMIRAFAHAVKEAPELMLLMVGDGEMKAEAIQLAQELGIAGKVIFEKFRQDVPAVLNAVDMYCLPSLWEGFPIGVLEAMAMGKAVVASDVDGTREAVQHGENGVLVPAGDLSALAGTLSALAKDLSARERLGDNAYNTIRAQYSVEKMTRQIEQVYQKVQTT